MAPLSIQTYVVGSVQTNCYFAINDDTKEVLIIDMTKIHHRLTCL